MYSFQLFLDECLEESLTIIKSCADNVSRMDIEMSEKVIKAGWKSVCIDGGKLLDGDDRIQYLQNCYA